MPYSLHFLSALHIKELHPESGQALKVRLDAEPGRKVFRDHSRKGVEKVTEDRPFPREATAAGFLFLSQPLNGFAAKRRVIHIMSKQNYIHMNTRIQMHTVLF